MGTAFIAFAILAGAFYIGDAIKELTKAMQERPSYMRDSKED